jgi:NAD(P)H-hydrate epimerase
LLDEGTAGRVLTTRNRESHKGTYGHVYIVAGSRGKSGAALMAGQSALRAGAGLVTLLLPTGLQRHVAGRVPELMTEPLPETPEGTLDTAALEPILGFAKQADAIVIGPGLTTHDATKRLVQELVRLSPAPIVLDADGINAFAGKPEVLRNDAGRAVVITPHPGEMARLLGTSIFQVQAHRLETALRCSREYGWCTVLKGYRSIVATPDGRVRINPTGNPGMATGGTGDILAGMIGRFLAAWGLRFHGADLLALGDYVGTAVYLHGLAGDIAAAEKSEESLVATDLVTSMPKAFLSIVRGRPAGSRRKNAACP